MNKLAENLSYLRCKNELKQRQLAELIHVSRTALALYETKRSEPSLNTVIKIAEIFEVTIDQLLKTDIK